MTNWEKDTEEGRAYVKREREAFLKDLARADRGTSGEKRAAMVEWIKDATEDPELVAERIGWLLAGHYGKGSHDAAWEQVASTFVKPTMWLLNTIATLEWLVPASYVSQTYKHVPAENYARLVAVVEREVAKAKTEI